MTQDLFFQPHVEFEKVASETVLPEDPNAWPNEIMQALFKQVPYVSDFEPHVQMDTVDAERGYALGHVEITNKTELQHGASDEALEGAGVQTARIPIIVKDKKLQPFDLLLTKDSKMLPLTEARLRQVVFRPQAFDITARTPGDQSMIGQLYPPQRQNYGMGGGGGGVSMGASMGKQGMVDEPGGCYKCGKTSCTCKKSGSVKEAGPLSALSGWNARRKEKTKETWDSFDALDKDLKKEEATHKQATPLLLAILPTINEGDYDRFCSKVASDRGLTEAFRHNPGAKHALAILGAYEAPSAAKLAAGLYQSLTPSVVQVLAAPGGGYLVKSASHHLWAPETELWDRAQVLHAFGEKIALDVDLAGGATMAPEGGVSEAHDPEADKADLIDQFGIYKVQDEAGRHVIGYVFPNLLDIDGKSLPLALFTNGAQRAVQGEIAGINVGGGASLFEGEPKGMGAFYEILPNGRAQATVPLTIKATMQRPDTGEGVTMTAETFDGRPVQVMIQANIAKVTLVDGTMCVPDTFSWLPLDKAEPVSLASSGDAFQKEARRNPFTHVYVGSDGTTFSVDGLPTQKLASSDRQFLTQDDALFLLVGFGCDPDYALSKMGEAAAQGKQASVLVGREIVLARDALAAAREGAAQKLAGVPTLRQDLVKEAAVIPDPSAVDTVLSLGFINPENLATFISYLPTIEESQSKMCELLLASRMGIRELPTPALERAIRTTEDALQGLKLLAFSQN